MKQRFRVMTAMILALLWLSNFASAQESRRRQATSRDPGSQNLHDMNPPSEAFNPGEPARLIDVRFVPAEDFTRVFMEVSRPVRYEVGRLPEDTARGLPPRIYVDIIGTQLAMQSLEPIDVLDGGLKQIRVGQFDQDTVRVVLDMTAPRDHTAFLLPEPFRVVLDIKDGANAPVSTAKAKPSLPATVTAKRAKPQPTGIRKIVLDPGHGGKDPGAIGVGGLEEKDIVLSVAKKLAAKLKKEMAIEVVLTRTD
ncbi:MAG: N-acetylmuramoyl-L-alanine amidase, partial [Candidatus Binatia bacterium]